MINDFAGSHGQQIGRIALRLSRLPKAQCPARAGQADEWEGRQKAFEQRFNCYGESIQTAGCELREKLSKVDALVDNLLLERDRPTQANKQLAAVQSQLNVQLCKHKSQGHELSKLLGERMHQLDLRVKGAVQNHKARTASVSESIELKMAEARGSIEEEAKRRLAGDKSLTELKQAVLANLHSQLSGQQQRRAQFQRSTLQLLEGVRAKTQEQLARSSQQREEHEGRLLSALQFALNKRLI